MDLQHHVDGLDVRRATTADVPAMQALFEADAPFWITCEGAPPRPTEAAALFTELPPDVPASQKQVFLVRDGDAPVAVIDLVAGFPDAATHFLGLLFIAPAARGRGLGTRLLRALAAHVAASGGTALRLAVVVENPRAKQLYERLGFQPVAFARRPRITWTGATIFVDVLELALSSAPPRRA